ncbi:MAG: RNA 2',3'-cyclic phosphodiesterase [Patescibacteria group bacterium]
MIIIFCGIPGSGKTTIAKRLVEHLRKQGSVKHFISDELKPPVYKKFFQILPENLGKYDFLIFDATFYKKEWREKMKQLAKGEKLLMIYLECPLQIAIQRNKKRRAGIPEEAVHIMAANFEKPDRADVVIDTQKTAVSESVKKIMNYIKIKKRVFVAIGLSQSLQSKILEWERKFRNLPVRWLAGKNLHITLIPPWYAEEKEIEKIKKILNSIGGVIKPFEIKFEKVAFGPAPRQPRLIWAEGAVPGELIKLKTRIEKMLGQKPEKRPFFLHLTLARFRPEDFKSFPRQILNEKVEWKEEAQSFVLMESRLSRLGADYEVLRVEKLSGGLT